MAINLQRSLIEKGKRVAYRISKRQVSVVPPAVNFVGKTSETRSFTVERLG